MSVVAVVLAAGLSQRFKAGDKLLAPFHGKQLARHVADALAPLDLTAKIAVISNNELRECFEGFDIVKLKDGLGGQSASIRAGLAKARLSNPDKILIVLADMPGVTPQLLETIIATTTLNRPAAATNGQRAMPPACFPASYYGQLESLSGDSGARDILKGLPPSARVAAPPSILHDIDRIEDLPPPMSEERNV